jgi:hypothetical protein
VNVAVTAGAEDSAVAAAAAENWRMAAERRGAATRAIRVAHDALADMFGLVFVNVLLEEWKGIVEIVLAKNNGLVKMLSIFLYLTLPGDLFRNCHI